MKGILFLSSECAADDPSKKYDVLPFPKTFFERAVAEGIVTAGLLQSLSVFVSDPTLLSTINRGWGGNCAEYVHKFCKH